jgi:hypothetical protein
MDAGVRDIIRDFLDPEDNLSTALNTSGIYEVEQGKPATTKLTDAVVDEAYIMLLNSIEAANSFIARMKGGELVRFNNGKPKFSHIDFSLWFIDQEPNINEIKLSTKELINVIRDLAIGFCFDKDADFDTTQRLKYLQVATYQLALRLEYGDNVYDTYTLDLKVFEPMARVLEFGAKKYERNNWRLPGDPCEIIDSLLRHLRDINAYKETDADSNLPHIGHLMCNVMFLTYQYM